MCVCVCVCVRVCVAMSEGKKTRSKPPPIQIGGSESQAADCTDGGFISGVGSVAE